jgi:hypothetical protein
MNKKSAVIHWIVFGVLAAFGLFFVFTADIGIKGLDGEWQLNFLENYYLKAEEDLLAMGQTAKFAGWQSILETAGEGGFAKESECGVLEGFNLWNDQKGFCAVDIKNNVLLKVKEKLGGIYSEFKLEGKELVGKGKKKTHTSAHTPKSSLITIPYVSYTYDTSFRVNLGVDIEDSYGQLFVEAIDLVSACSDDLELEGCIEVNKGSNWKLFDCDEEEFVEIGRKVLFCVGTAIIVQGEAGELVPLKYEFALDFTEVE